ncbi:MAG: hypothetical protein ABW168_19310 [Sedimenticola sp.]
MNSKLVSVLIILSAVATFAFMVKMMSDMSNSMTVMTHHMGALAKDVSSMNRTMSQMSDSTTKMSESMIRMESSIEDMGRAFGQGSKQMQQWNPVQMMPNMLPGAKR